MTPFAAALLEAKRAGEPNAPKIPVTVVRPRQPFQAGPFEVEYVSVSHSIPESNALAIRTPAGTVLHTGDWKLDPAPGVGPATDSDRFASLGQEGVLALVSDSTNAIRDGVSPSEGEVAKVLERLIAEAPQRVAVTTFASNVARIRAVAAAAQRVRARGGGGRTRHPPLRRCGARARLSRRSAANFSTRRPTLSCRATRWSALMTGSQGEPRAALAKIASGDPRALPLSAGDRVDLLLAHHSRQRAGGEHHRQRAGRSRRRGDHRPRRARSHVRPSAPRRAPPALRLDEARRSSSRCTGRRCICTSRRSSRALPASRRCWRSRNGQMVRLAPGPAEVLETGHPRQALSRRPAYSSRTRRAVSPIAGA